MSLLFHNNTVSLYDNWYESHASLLRAVCLELGHSDKINELMEKFVGEKMKMKAKKNKNLPKKESLLTSFTATKSVQHCWKRRKRREERLTLEKLPKNWEQCGKN